MYLRHLPKRIALTAALIVPLLSGCAGNAAMNGIETAIFGDGPLPAAAVAVASDTPVIAGEPSAYAASQVTWGEPQIVPAGFGNAPQAVADTDGPYLLDSGDKLRIFVYGQPNLSRGYSVGHDGRITVPLIGSVEARGHTTRELEGIIKARLGRDYVRDPQVTVDIQQNRPFFILGEVKNAGQYSYVSGMTVLTAVAIAGGFSERASDRSFRISRRVNGFVDVVEAPADYIVQAGDTVEVHERFF